MGKMWVVPLNVETATQRESGLKAMSWIKQKIDKVQI
jgi:hypothetical protein